LTIDDVKELKENISKPIGNISFYAKVKLDAEAQKFIDEQIKVVNDFVFSIEQRAKVNWVTQMNELKIISPR